MDKQKTNLLKSWDNYEEQEKKVIKDFKKFLYNNLVIERGKKENNINYTFGFPYTSSSSFAAIWNTNTQAKLKNTNLYFRGLAIDADNNTIAIFDDETEETYYKKLGV